MFDSTLHYEVVNLFIVDTKKDGLQIKKYTECREVNKLNFKHQIFGPFFDHLNNKIDTRGGNCEKERSTNKNRHHQKRLRIEFIS